MPEQPSGGKPDPLVIFAVVDEKNEITTYANTYPEATRAAYGQLVDHREDRVVGLEGERRIVRLTEAGR